MKCWGCLAAVAGVLLLLACAGMAAPAEAAFFLVTGWLFFLSNALPQLSVNGTGVATAVLALAVFVVGLHRFGTWWTAALPAIGDDQPPRAWRWRWTLIATAAVVLSFAAGIAVVGATHQLVWMATSDQPLAESSWKDLRGRTEARSKLKQIGTALHNYEMAEQRFPAGGVFDRIGRPLFSWQTALLPYVNQQGLLDRIHLELPWDAPENAAALAVVVPTYVIDGLQPEERRDSSGRALTHFAGNGRVVNAGPGIALSSFKDGTSNTFLAGEAKARFKPWGDPVNWRDARLGINRSPDGFGSPWSGGTHLLMADGSVRFVSDNLDQQVLDALATPDGGETVGEF